MQFFRLYILIYAVAQKFLQFHDIGCDWINYENKIHINRGCSETTQNSPQFCLQVTKPCYNDLIMWNAADAHSVLSEYFLEKQTDFKEKLCNSALMTGTGAVCRRIGLRWIDRFSFFRFVNYCVVTEMIRSKNNISVFKPFLTFIFSFSFVWKIPVWVFIAWSKHVEMFTNSQFIYYHNITPSATKTERTVEKSQ